ncbi:MAG: DUF2332 domain-containing protein [Actinocrinis sp.]
MGDHAVHGADGSAGSAARADALSGDLERLRRMFANAAEFSSSPLYTSLSATVAREPALLRLAARGRPGQYPTFLFFAAVHALLLGGAQHELGRFYPTIVGAAHAQDATSDRGRAAAGTALVSFAAEHEDGLARLIETRLVQTNSVKRSLALRVALALLAREIDAPVHLVEVGASAGVHLRFDRFGYQLAGRRFGVPDSPVQITSQWRGGAQVPDLDALPALASTVGVDLNPLDAADPADRRWLEALVFPENRHQAALLRDALAVVAEQPPQIRAGDAVDVCPQLGRELPVGEPRVVFHSATRMHVPQERVAAFEDAIESIGEHGPLYRVWLEGSPDVDPRPQPAEPGAALTLRRPGGQPTDVAIVEGRLEWIELL